MAAVLRRAGGGGGEEVARRRGRRRRRRRSGGGVVDPRVGRRGFLGIRARRWWLRPRGGHAHGKRGSGWLGTGTEIETGPSMRSDVGGRAAAWTEDVSEVELFC